MADKKCPACNGNGGKWVLVNPVGPTKNGQRKPGQQKWQKCGRCGGKGTI